MKIRTTTFSDKAWVAKYDQCTKIGLSDKSESDAVLNLLAKLNHSDLVKISHSAWNAGTLQK